MVKTGVVTAQPAAADLGFSGIRLRGSGVYWDLRSIGLSESLVSEPEAIHCNSLEAQQGQQKPSELMVVPLLGGIPPGLKKLHLRQCDLVDADISVLVAALRQNASIQVRKSKPP